MSTTTYTTTIDIDHRAKRDDGRRNNTREGRSTIESYIRDVMALEIKSLRKRKVLYVKPRPRGEGLKNFPKVEILYVSKFF